MQKKTFNLQRPTLDIEWLGTRENEPPYGAKNGEKKQSQFDPEDRLLEFAVRLTSQETSIRTAERNTK